MIRPIDTMKRWWKNGEHALHGPESPAESRLLVTRPAPPAPAEPPWLATLDQLGMPRSLVYPTTTLGRIVDQSADRFGDATALIYGDARWTYRELLSRVNRMAGGLASLGVRRGERVLLTLPNCPEFVVTFFAVQKLGAVVINAGPLMGADDLRAVIAMTSPRVAVGIDLQSPLLAHVGDRSTLEAWVWVSLQEYQPVFRRLGYQFKLWHHRNGKGPTLQVELSNLLERAPSRPPTIEPDADRTAVLQPTGGTTGTLKLAELSHRSLLANATQATALMGCRPGQDRIMAVLPMFHVYGLTTCLTAGIYSAATLILATRFQAGPALELLREHKPTIFPLVPAICDALSNELERDADGAAPPPLEGLRLCLSGAAPLPEATAKRFQRLTGAQVVEGYGLTEASPVTHVNPPAKPRVGSIGLPLPDTRVRVVDLETGLRDVGPGEPGEMLISGPQVMNGYFANPEQTDLALHRDHQGHAWLRTGDVVRYDEDGYFYVMDRRKDMIIRSGMKVYPARVEKVLSAHRRVAEVGVVGRPDPVHTETVVAVIALNDSQGDRGKDADSDREQLATELRGLCREHLAPYEVPGVIEFVDKLPRSPLGKLLKRELRKPPAMQENKDEANGGSPASQNGNGRGGPNGKH
jgi:long-chain acyl-CoA synthetase